MVRVIRLGKVLRTIIILAVIAIVLGMLGFGTLSSIFKWVAIGYAAFIGLLILLPILLILIILVIVGLRRRKKARKQYKEESKKTLDAEFRVK